VSINVLANLIVVFVGGMLVGAILPVVMLIVEANLNAAEHILDSGEDVSDPWYFKAYFWLSQPLQKWKDARRSIGFWLVYPFAVASLVGTRAGLLLSAMLGLVIVIVASLVLSPAGFYLWDPFVFVAAAILGYSAVTRVAHRESSASNLGA